MRWDLLVAETKEQARRLRIHSRGRTRVKRLRFDYGAENFASAEN